MLRYPRLQEFYGLTEALVFDYVKFLRRSSEIVTLDPLVSAPIRDVNDIIVMQTAIIGEPKYSAQRTRIFSTTPPANTCAGWGSPFSMTSH